MTSVGTLLAFWAIAFLPLFFLPPGRQLLATLVGCVGGVAGTIGAVYAFPLWRKELSTRDRKTLMNGTFIGMLLGAIAGGAAALTWLSGPEHQSILGAVLCVTSTTLVTGVVGGTIATYRIPMFRSITISVRPHQEHSPS
jgi:hypothetical protein